MTEAQALITIVVRALLESETPAVREAGAACVTALLREGLLQEAVVQWNEPSNLWYNSFDGRKYLCWKEREA